MGRNGKWTIDEILGVGLYFEERIRQQIVETITRVRDNNIFFPTYYAGIDCIRL